MYNYYETIIVGAGAGGLMAGRYLKDALIVDKKEEIGRPVRSGEGISQLALERLKIKINPSWVSAQIKCIQRITPNGMEIGSVKRDTIGYIIDKCGFEKDLAQSCLAQIKLRTEITDLSKRDGIWEVKTNDGRIFQSKFLIGADGAASIVRGKISAEKLEIVPAIQYLVELGKEITTSVAKIYLNNTKFPQGYAWIFPKSRKTANIGLGGEGNLNEKFKLFLEETVKNGYGDFRLLENRSGVVSFCKLRSKISKENALLIGDAAGLADPVFLGGMNQAMTSGKIAAECISGNKVDLYEKKIRAMPFADIRLVEARRIFYSFSDETLDELGDVLEGKGTSYLQTFPGILKLLTKTNLRKNYFSVFKFFSIWRKDRDHLW